MVGGGGECVCVEFGFGVRVLLLGKSHQEGGREGGREGEGT